MVVVAGASAGVSVVVVAGASVGASVEVANISLVVVWTTTGSSPELPQAAASKVMAATTAIGAAGIRRMAGA